MEKFFDTCRPRPEQVTQVNNAKADLLSDLYLTNGTTSPMNAIHRLPLAVWLRASEIELINRDRSIPLGMGQFIDHIPNLKMALNNAVTLTVKELTWCTSSLQGAQSGMLEFQHRKGETMQFSFNKSTISSATCNDKRLELRDGADESAHFIGVVGKLVKDIYLARPEDVTPEW